MESAAEIISDLDKFANTPYLTEDLSAYLHQRFEGHNSFQIAEDHLGLYLNYKHGNPKHKVIIDSHLDHPGFIMRRDGIAVPIGSIAGQDDIEYLKKFLPYPVNIIDKESQKPIEGLITGLYSINQKTELKIEYQKGATKLRNNVQIQLILENDYQSSTIKSRSADNHAASTSMISVIDWIEHERPISDVTFIFSKLEEIKQSSSTLLALRNFTPFGKIYSDTLIIVLEAGLMGSNINTDSILGGEGTNYENGPVVRVGDDDLIFSSSNTYNLSESAALNALEASGGQYQHGMSVSYSNATPYTLFSDSNNVVGITIPCRFKHNMDPLRGFVPEEVYSKDIEITTQILKHILFQTIYGIDLNQNAILKGEISNNPDLIQRKRRSWAQTARWTEPRLKSNHLYSENLIEYIQFSVNSIKNKFHRES